MRPPIIGVTGKARSGKDTVVRFIIACSGGYQYAFADPIRAMLRAGFGIDMNDVYWSVNKERPISAFDKSPRQMMQTLGTEWGRNMIHKDVWLLLAKNQLINSGPGMVVSDVRFDNEAAWIRSMGGRVVHVTREDAPMVNSHESENGVELKPADSVIRNTGTLEELQASVRNMMGEL